MFRTGSVLAIAGVLALFLTTPLFADDLAQIEKATQIADDAANTWAPMGAFEKEEALLAQAEQQLAGVDEVGKAPVVARIKDYRDRIASAKDPWNAGSVKGAIERTVSKAENFGDRGQGDALEGTLKDVETALADGWLKSHLDATVISDLEKKVAWTRKKFASTSNRSDSRALTGWLGRILDEAKRYADGAASSSGMDGSFNDQIKKAEELLAKDENKKILGDDLAKYQKQIADLKVVFTKNALDYKFAAIDKNVQWLKEFLDGKMPNVYTNNVEDRFKWVNEGLAKVPANDPRTAMVRATVDQQRKTFDAGQAQGEHDAVVKPMVDYWKYCNDEYAKQGEGWEAETTPPDLKTFLMSRSIGCEKTEKLLIQVVQRYLDDDRVKKAVAQFPTDPAVKKVHDEATAVLEKGGGKICSFTGKLLDEGEKLPAGHERSQMVDHLDGLKHAIEYAAKGCAGGPAVLARIDALEKRFHQEKAAGEAAKEALSKKLCDASDAVWPGFKGVYQSQFKQIDSNDALENPGKWKGTVLFFDGGGPGVNLNRSGWSWYDDYEFIVEVHGVPICGDMDAGLLEAVKAVRKQTGGLEPYNCEEVVGIVDGLCKATPRVQNPLNHNDYFRDTPQKGVHMRIVAWKACTVAACVGKGTNLAKLPEFKEVSVSEAGSTGGGGGGSSSGGSSSGGGFVHFIHRFVAWAMCALLAIAGALALAHGASKFVPQIQEQKAKLGDYLGYAGAGFAVAGVVWFGVAIVLPFIFSDVRFGSLPSVALILGGAASGLDLVRLKGKITPELAATLQPAGILFGLGCFAAAAVHFFCWDFMLL